MEKKYIIYTKDIKPAKFRLSSWVIFYTKKKKKNTHARNIIYIIYYTRNNFFADWWPLPLLRVVLYIIILYYINNIMYIYARVVTEGFAFRPRRSGPNGVMHSETRANVAPPSTWRKRFAGSKGRYRLRRRRRRWRRRVIDQTSVPFTRRIVRITPQPEFLDKTRLMIVTCVCVRARARVCVLIIRKRLLRGTLCRCVFMYLCI